MLLEYQDCFSFEGYSALANSLGLLHLFQSTSDPSNNNQQNSTDLNFSSTSSNSNSNSSISLLSYQTNHNEDNDTSSPPPVNSTTNSPKLQPIQFNSNFNSMNLNENSIIFETETFSLNSGEPSSSSFPSSFNSSFNSSNSSSSSNSPFSNQNQNQLFTSPIVQFRRKSIMELPCTSSVSSDEGGSSYRRSNSLPSTMSNNGGRAIINRNRNFQVGTAAGLSPGSLLFRTGSSSSGSSGSSANGRSDADSNMGEVDRLVLSSFPLSLFLPSFIIRIFSSSFSPFRFLSRSILFRNTN